MQANPTLIGPVQECMDGIRRYMLFHVPTSHEILPYFSWFARDKASQGQTYGNVPLPDIVKIDML
jgi:hypothetical protein